MIVFKPVLVTLINVAQAGNQWLVVLPEKFKSYEISVLEVMQEGHE